MITGIDNSGDHVELDRRAVEPGTEATTDFRFDLVREAEEQGFEDVQASFEYYED